MKTSKRIRRKAEQTPQPTFMFDEFHSLEPSLIPGEGVSDLPYFGHDFSRVQIHAVRPETLQTKLTINQPGDSSEQEAEHVAEQVMQMETSPSSEAPPMSQDARLALTPKEMSGTSAREVGSFLPLVNEVLSSSDGQPLDDSTRSFMEPRFGHDFSRVRIHTDERAVTSAQAVNARAYTVGNNIVFGTGQYVPQTYEGNRLLAHELTHTIQQEANEQSIHDRLTITQPGDQAEQEAENVSRAVMHGEDILSPSVSVARVARDPGDGGTQAPPVMPVGNAPILYDRSNFDNRYEGVVYPWQATIVLRMSVKFEREGPGWVDPVTKAPTPESEAEARTVLQKFAQDFKTVVEQGWSYKYDLKPACPVDVNLQYHAKVQIDLVDDNPDTTIHVFRKVVGGRSNADTGISALQEGDTTETERDWNYKGEKHVYYQIPALHEFGHLIGLKHIHCDSNADNCYGVTPEESLDIMGRGYYVSPRDYEPFKRIAERYGKDYLPPDVVKSCNQWQTVEAG